MATTQPRLRTGTPGNGKASDGRAIFRRWLRYRLQLPVRLIISRDENIRITDGRASDISEGGMLIFAGLELRPGDKVAIEFTPPFSNAPVRAPGIVRHRRGYNYGVEFLPETALDQEQIDKFRSLMQLAAGDATQ
jgi:PilZ domain